ncbi:hypothetical protein H6F95_14950 [Cyanobacteria bacterium FACHB-471]|nr:hypothetical protein [Cyanobacteria bacterium FACHB-471]
MLLPIKKTKLLSAIARPLTLTLTPNLSSETSDNPSDLPLTDDETSRL